MFDDPDCAYFSQRARQEALRAIAAEHPVAAAIHQQLCLLYTGRVLDALFDAAPAGRS
ncbi:hypothetical protein [Sphingomonas radiodurans]|uniref:hypothetical protein n=1 Tax=Sphingomonas radiodurans TaxID=2890321 RepID=UPI001E3FC755|nr:hypothetical protein [Sphingomonas radiodurans]WBH17060.1 hypothetical protein LLW23_02765 [Sphingomonas radiodurans]